MAQPTYTDSPDAPSRGDPTNFRVKMDAFLAWMPGFKTFVDSSLTWVTDSMTSIAASVLAASGSASASASSASASSGSADDAEASHQAAAAAAGVSAWVSSASYTENDPVFSPINKASYRAKTTHSGETTDPSSDTTNWAPIMTLSQATNATFLGETTFEAVSEVITTLSGTTPTMDLEDGNVFKLTTSGNTTLSVTNTPAGRGWCATITVVLGGTHTFAITGADWGEGGAPADLASGDSVKITLDGDGSSIDAFEAWRKT